MQKKLSILILSLLLVSLVFSKSKKNNETFDFIKSNVHCFSPQGRCDNWLIANWYKAKKSIDIAIYSFTDKKLLRVLDKLRNKGVKIRILLTKRAITTRYGLTKKLIAKKYNSRVWMSRGKMHNKFSIIDNKRVITGSYNYSKSAKKRNAENMVILNREDIANFYTKYFNHMWYQSCRSHKIKVNYRKKIFCNQ